MPYYDDEMTDRAVRAYFRRLKALGFDNHQIDQPNRHDTFRNRDVVTIATGDRLLGRYRVVREDGEERLRRIEG